jgi:hypothetical protein
LLHGNNDKVQCGKFQVEPFEISEESNMKNRTFSSKRGKYLSIRDKKNSPSGNKSFSIREREKYFRIGE